MTRSSRGTPKVKKDSSIPDCHRSARNPKTIGNQWEVGLPFPSPNPTLASSCSQKNTGWGFCFVFVFFTQESYIELRSLCSWSQRTQPGQHPRNKLLTRWEGVRGVCGPRGGQLWRPPPRVEILVERSGHSNYVPGVAPLDCLRRNPHT